MAQPNNLDEITKLLESLITLNQGLVKSIQELQRLFVAGPEGEVMTNEHQTNGAEWDKNN